MIIKNPSFTVMPTSKLQTAPETQPKHCYISKAVVGIIFHRLATRTTLVAFSSFSLCLSKHYCHLDNGWWQTNWLTNCDEEIDECSPSHCCMPSLWRRNSAVLLMREIVPRRIRLENRSEAFFSGGKIGTGKLDWLNFTENGITNFRIDDSIKVNRVKMTDTCFQC